MMSALAKEIEADRIKEAIEQIGKHIVGENALVSVRKVEIVCGGRCQAALTISYSIGIDELIHRLANEGWCISDDRMLCPVCAETGNPDYWRDQL